MSATTVERPMSWAADPDLPHRDLLLDPAWVSARFGPVARRRVKYRIGESLRAVYTHQESGGLLAARMMPGRAVAELERAQRDAVPVAGHPGVELDAEHDIVWWRLPNDRRLTGVADVLTPRGRHPEAPTWSRSVIAEYAPERSLTVRATTSEDEVLGYAKLYRFEAGIDERVTRLRALALALAARGVRIATARWWDATRRLVFLEPMPGVDWSQLAPTQWPAVLEALAAAIAHLHEHGPAALHTVGATPPAAFARLAPARVRTSAELIGRIRPDLADPAARLATALTEHVPEPGPATLLHGDCHPKNVVVDRGAVALIDLDQSGVGPAACDLASLFAMLHQGALHGRIAPTALPVLVDAARRGYQAVRPLPDPREIDHLTAAALLVERGVRAVNRVDARAIDALDLTLDRAGDVLAGSWR